MDEGGRRRSSYRNYWTQGNLISLQILGDFRGETGLVRGRFGPDIFDGARERRSLLNSSHA